MMAFPGADVDRDEVLAMPNHHLLPSQSDRWIEADLFVFQDQPVEPQVRKFFDRYEPLYRCVTGDRGVILCCGWFCDLVTEWTGTADQPLPFRSRSAGRWRESSYQDLQHLIRVIKQAAADVGLAEFKVGVSVVDWGEFNWGEGHYYDLDSGWYRRHPEVYFRDSWKNPDFRKRLQADDYPYASQPGGVAEGTSFGELFAKQWAVVSEFLDLDAILLRDGFLGPCIYELNGPFGNLRLRRFRSIRSGRFSGGMGFQPMPQGLRTRATVRVN